MTLDQLQVIETIVESGSFSAAAKTLHRAQSAVSYAVKSLEEEWGLKIFDRSQYRPTLTEEGIVLLNKARVVLSNVEALQLLSENLSAGTEAKLRVAVSMLCPMDTLTGKLKRFAKTCPHTNLELSVEHLNDAETRLSQGEVDLAITMHPRDSSGLDMVDFTNLSLISTGTPDYVEQGEIAQTSLIDKTQIIVSQLGPVVDQKKDGGGVLAGATQWRVADFPTKLSFIRGGLGYGYMPDHYVNSYLNNGSLCEIKCMKPVPINLKVLRRLKDPMGPAKSFLWETLSNQF